MLIRINTYPHWQEMDRAADRVLLSSHFEEYGRRGESGVAPFSLSAVGKFQPRDDDACYVIYNL